MPLFTTLYKRIMMCLDKARYVMRATHNVASGIKSLLPFNAWDSFDSARLKDAESTYLDPEHVNELRENSEITDWEVLSTQEIKDIGKLESIGFVTKKGYAYSAVVGTPFSPESSVPVIGTSAWLTSVMGHNEHTVRNLVRAGNFTIFVGAEGSYRPEEKAQPTGPITLADSAAAVLNFTYHAVHDLPENVQHYVDGEKRIVVGESRGGMVGMGLAALAEDFGQEVIYADLVAPCLPRSMEFSDLRKFKNQILSEPQELAKLASRLTLARIIHYPATLDLNPTSLKHQAAIGFALFSGEAGALAQNTPKDTLMHITVFDNDFASMRDEWEDIFKLYPNVRITPLAGSHMTLADLETLKYVIARNKAIQACLTENEPATPSTVFDAAHLFVPQQRPLPLAS